MLVLNSDSVELPLSERLLAASCAVALGGGSVAVAYFDPTTSGFFPICPLYTLTGLACPGCGLTRGFHALFHGDIVTALDYNALLPACAFIFGYFLLSLTLMAARGKGLSFKLFNAKLLWGFLCVGVVFAVLRNLPFYPVNVLYP